MNDFINDFALTNIFLSVLYISYDPSIKDQSPSVSIQSNMLLLVALPLFKNDFALEANSSLPESIASSILSCSMLFCFYVGSSCSQAPLGMSAISFSFSSTISASNVSNTSFIVSELPALISKSFLNFLT